MAQERITMYKLAGQLSEAISAAEGTPTKVREQQLYNYRAKGLIKVGADGRVSQKEADEFIAKTIVGRKERAERKAAKMAEATDAELATA